MNKIIENLRYMIDGYYGERVVWTKDSKIKAKLTSRRNEISTDDKALLSELKDLRNYIDAGIKTLEEKERGEGR